MNSYTATAHFDGTVWQVQCDQLPQARSQVIDLAEAEEFIIEAISYVIDAPETDIDVVVTEISADGQAEAKPAG